MIARIRTAVFCAVFAVVSLFPTLAAAGKAFKNSELAFSAIVVEAKIRTDAGVVTKSAPKLKTEADAAKSRHDIPALLAALRQIAATKPGDAENWLALARAIPLTPPPAPKANAAGERDDDRPSETARREELLEQASAVAFIAYQRAGNPQIEAEALAVLGDILSRRQVWRPALDALRASLDLREDANVRDQHQKLRDQRGFRMLDYDVHSDTASPRVCFQFSEALAKRTDFAPFVTLDGEDRPALSVEGSQLCVDGLRHGERYNITLRQGLPSSVREELTKTAEFSIYVRDRKPSARFTSRAYVLPSSGQRGIPIVSVNTGAIAISVLRIGDRNLVNTVIGSDFQNSLTGYQFRELGSSQGAKIWSGELTSEVTRNQEVTTTFPVDQVLGALQPGLYVMSAAPKGDTATADTGSGEDGDERGGLATQWFIVSDLGVAAYSGNDGIHVFVNSLASTRAMARAEVRLIARNNEILATRSTDDSGHAVFESGLARGQGGLAPAMVTVTAGDGAHPDYAFLSLRTNAFDFTDRGVAGRAVPSGADAFVYSERGVYRSSETVHLTALLRDALGNAVTATPLTLVVERPDGVEFARSVVADQGMGGRSLSFALNAAVPTGTWRVRAFTDPRGSAIGETTFMVEDYVPDRIEFDLTAKDNERMRAEVPVELTVAGHFLYGAPAAHLRLEGEIVVKPATERPGFAGYRFGTSDEETVSDEPRSLGDLPQSDAHGAASFPVTLGIEPSANRPQEARISVRMAEAGGRGVTRMITLPVVPPTAMIGVKPLFRDNNVGEGDKADFDVVLASPEGKPLSRDGLRYELLKIETRYQWYRHNRNWDFEPVRATVRTGEGLIAVAADKPSRISLAPEVGHYRLDVKTTDGDKLLTSVEFDVGWYASGTSTPDLLETSIDKPQYQSGDSMTVSVNARSAGRLTINVIGDRLLTTQSVDVRPGTAQVRLNVGKDWGTGAYVLATLRRPLDAAAQRMPGRAIGMKWFGIDHDSRTLGVRLSPPAQVRPLSTLKIPVRLEGLNPGEDARVVIAAVDVGILNLTSYKPPQPESWFLGQRQLATEIRDLYGQLIDGMQGNRGLIRTGGDSGAFAVRPAPPSQRPLALYSGIVTVAADGTAEVSFEIPQFAGTARVMATAWSATKVGHAATDVVIRDPVVVNATLPRFLLTGDRSSLHLDIDNVEAAGGDYHVTVKAEGEVQLTGEAASTLNLAAGERKTLSLGLSAIRPGAAAIEVGIAGPGGLTLSRHYDLEVKPATQVLARRTVQQIARGESLTLSSEMLGDLVPGTGAISVSASLSSALDAASLIRALERYPYGCSEQLTSISMALLYVNDLAQDNHLPLDPALEQRIKQSIEQLLARQGSNGAFGLWSADGNGDPWLDAYVTDFLTRAREKGFVVPNRAFRSALDHIRNAVNNSDVNRDGGRELAYGLYVLARNGVAPIGDLRYLADSRLDRLDTAIAKAQLAAALALVGDRNRSERTFEAAIRSLPEQPRFEFGRRDYGSQLRDGAAVVALGGEANAPQAGLMQAVQRIEAARGLTPYLSTQDNAWLVLAARALAREKLALDVDGQAMTSAFFRNLRASELDGRTVTITNRGDSPLQLVVSVSGSPVTPEPAVANGFKIERNYFTLDGKPADISKVTQTSRLVVVLKVTESDPHRGQIMVADYLPAGLEIDNPALVSGGDAGAFEWITDGVKVEHSEFRDDRFTAAILRDAGETPVFTVAYVVRAVSPGTYVLPQASVEDMYNPSRHGRTATGSVEVSAKGSDREKRIPGFGGGTTF
ncbi:MAG: alpha-2-macroglobulin family protein [Alphaproteobacteria bacterium]|nr:alpha-2-macroglobulin family protein [Alphaproteobacteria bacterium]